MGCKLRAQSQKHKHALTTHHVRLKLRLDFFDSVFPMALSGLTRLPLSKFHVQRSDITQHKMLRTNVGWVGVDSKVWETNLQRMNDKINCSYVFTPHPPVE